MATYKVGQVLKLEKSSHHSGAYVSIPKGAKIKVEYIPQTYNERYFIAKLLEPKYNKLGWVYGEFTNNGKYKDQRGFHTFDTVEDIFSFCSEYGFEVEE